MVPFKFHTIGMWIQQQQQQKQTKRDVVGKSFLMHVFGFELKYKHKRLT